MRETLRVVNDMRRAGVIGEYAIGGAIAASMWLEPFTTKDLDIFVELPLKSGLLSLSEIYGYLTGRGYKPRGQFIQIEGWDVEFLHPTSGLEREAIEQAASVTVQGVRNVRIMQPEHLVAICLQTGRTKDFQRITAFLEQKRVDLRKLRGVIGRFGLEQKWEEFLAKYPPTDNEPRNPDKERRREHRRNLPPGSKASLLEELRDVGESFRKARRSLR
ncbi:MAG: hypothetical protein JOZ10_12695 [Acidobacteria bacterium]|nr:hypothetical protein [Acidobacteriota bacterium]MBV9145599.1 hypothetical protein [Acidobacteriota bacterium]MBV9435322.1 hypothetical protein [Acidobacteriota bacterium]